MSVRYSGQANGFNKLVVPQLSTVQTAAVQNILRNLVTWANNLASPNPASGDVLTIKTGIGAWLAAGGGGAPLIWVMDFTVTCRGTLNRTGTSAKLTFTGPSSIVTSTSWKNNTIALATPIVHASLAKNFKIVPPMSSYKNSSSIVSLNMVTSITISTLTGYGACYAFAPIKGLRTYAGIHTWTCGPNRPSYHTQSYAFMCGGTNTTFQEITITSGFITITAIAGGGHPPYMTTAIRLFTGQIISMAWV